MADRKRLAAAFESHMDRLQEWRRDIATLHQLGTQPGRMFWLWWKTLSGSYVVFTSTSRS